MPVTCGCLVWSPVPLVYRWLQDSLWAQAHPEIHWLCWNYKSITVQGQRVRASRWRVLTADWRDAPLRVQIKENSPIIVCDPETIIGIWELHDWVKGKKYIFCPLCNKSQQRLCLLMRTENMSFSPTSPIKLILKSSSVACCGTCERQKICQHCKCNELDHFHSTDRPHRCLECEQVNLSHSLYCRSQIQAI